MMTLKSSPGVKKEGSAGPAGEAGGGGEGVTAAGAGGLKVTCLFPCTNARPAVKLRYKDSGYK
jgi:hypothetical protein